MKLLKKPWKTANKKETQSLSNSEYQRQKLLKSIKKGEKESWRKTIKEIIEKKGKWQEQMREKEKKKIDARILAFKRRKRQ